MKGNRAPGGRGVTTIVVGPVHAGIIEPGRFTFESGGESVLRLEAQLGFSRRGVEAFLAGRDAIEAARCVARICGACSAARSWAYALALESLADTTCDRDAELARIVVAELERLYNHVFDLASACSAAGFAKGQIAGLELKERLHRINAAHAGHRLLFDAIVPGGVSGGVLRDPGALVRELDGVRTRVERFTDDVFRNGSLLRRFHGTGRVAPETALRLGAVGPAARASGGTIDLRRARPYGAYAEFVPAFAHATDGDAEARCRVKSDEIVVSFETIRAALVELGGRVPPARKNVELHAGEAAAAVEGPRGAESIEVRVDGIGRLTHASVRGASAANWPVVVAAMEGNIVPDFPLVNKSFNLCYACADL